MEETDITEITGEKLHTGQFKSGDEWTGNANGRPKGTFSLKTLIIKRLQENPEQTEKIINDLLLKDQGLVLQMIDGRPNQATDITTDGEKIQGVIVLPAKNNLDGLETTESTSNSIS
jgi:hypothetical protein